MHVATTERPALDTIGDVVVYRSGHGSAIAPVPGTSHDFWLLADRGPNIDTDDSDTKKLIVPSYSPRIYRAYISGSTLRIDDEIVLRRADGAPLSGLPTPRASGLGVAELALALDGTPIAPDPDGLDPEGLVALPDGTFWVSEEYGPSIVHFGADGREIERLDPTNGGVPEVYTLRRPNRGMEGLTITPDGEWLVGIMQGALENPTREGVRDVSRATRILFRHIASGTMREYLYLLDAAKIPGNSEILALSATRFLVLERDKGFLGGSPPAEIKRIYEIDVAGATDISSLGALGRTPIAGRRTIEQATVEEIEAEGIIPVSKALRVDLLASGYPHDKPEGLALAPDGTLLVTNDDDFGVTEEDGRLVQKLLPGSGVRDQVEVWQLRLR